MSKTFNYYCDESCHLPNDCQDYMVIGYICSAYNQVHLHQEAIRELKNRHKFNAEIKWSKVSHSKYLFYNDLIDYFFASDLQFRAIVVKKTDNANHLGSALSDLLHPTGMMSTPQRYEPFFENQTLFYPPQYF